MNQRNTLALVVQAMDFDRIRTQAAAFAVGAVLALAPATVVAQKAFPTAEAAAEAFVDAVARSDEEAALTVLAAAEHRFRRL